MRQHQRGEPDRFPSALAVVIAVIIAGGIFIAQATGLAEFLSGLMTLLLS